MLYSLLYITEVARRLFSCRLLNCWRVFVVNIYISNLLPFIQRLWRYMCFTVINLLPFTQRCAVCYTAINLFIVLFIFS